MDGVVRHDSVGRSHDAAGRPDRPWGLLTHHAHLLLAIAREPDARVRELAATVGVTPRAALDLLHDLERVGYLHRTRRGRRNHYTVHPDCALVDPEAGLDSVRDFLSAFGDLDPQGAGRSD
ncbi:MarR family transcriptional regulator [Trujillonella humicola]|uniref:MarR family transcriptional regulator n=1 Tax=Trujillonella humicola TaxID=3383699 RepID=UPI003905AF37